MLKVMTVVSAVAAFALVSQAAITYSNVAARVGVHPLLPAGQANSPEHGSRVTLAGFERALTRIDVKVRIGDSGVAQFDGRLKVYANDGPLGAPASLLWDSTARHFIIDSGADLTYSFQVPTVLVPSTFTWTFQITDRTGFNQTAMGPAYYHPPTIGSAAGGYWANNNGTWVFIPGETAFGAQVTSVGACSADFNHDGDTGTDADIEAFFACIGGNCCATCGSADFNNDGDVGTDLDIESFFRVLGGGPCS